MTPQERYERKHVSRVQLKFIDNTDADIIAQLKKVGNKQGYIKRLIRKDIQQNNVE